MCSCLLANGHQCLRCLGVAHHTAAQQSRNGGRIKDRLQKLNRVIAIVTARNPLDDLGLERSVPSGASGDDRFLELAELLNAALVHTKPVQEGCVGGGPDGGGGVGGVKGGAFGNGGGGDNGGGALGGGGGCVGWPGGTAGGKTGGGGDGGDGRSGGCGGGSGGGAGGGGGGGGGDGGGGRDGGNTGGGNGNGGGRCRSFLVDTALLQRRGEGIAIHAQLWKRTRDVHSRRHICAGSVEFLHNLR